MEGEGFGFKFFGDIMFINWQSREARSPFHHGASTALGDLLTHWGLLVQHTQMVEDGRELKKCRQRNRTVTRIPQTPAFRCPGGTAILI